MNIHKESSNKLKIALPIFVLITIFLLLIFNTLRVKYLQQESLQKLNNKIILVTKISEFLHELQKERGLSVGYLSTGTKSFKHKLFLQTAATDKVLNNIRYYYGQHNFHIAKMQNKVLPLLEHIITVRSLVVNKIMNAVNVRQYYTELNDALLDTVLMIIKTSQFDQLNNDAMAFVSLLYLEENGGLERALGTNILSLNHIAQSKINLFNTYIVREDVYRELFLKFASLKFINIYHKYFTMQEYHKIVAMRRIILSADEQAIHRIKPDEWFDHLTIMIDALKNMDHYLSHEMLVGITKEYQQSRESFFINIILGVIIFIIFIMMILIISGLKKSEQKLKNLLHKYIISSTTDLNGKITGVSKAFCDISGYREEELLGKAHNIVRNPDMPSELFADMWQTIKAGKIWQGEVKNLRKDGTYYWVTAVVSPLYNNGKKVGYSSVRQDITDAKRIEELNRSLQEKILFEVKKSREKDNQMIQQSRLAQMGEMISMIAHQWRQPLTAISATGSTLILKSRMQECVESKYIHDKSRKILEYANHLSNTIDDFRNFFQPDKEKKEVTLVILIQSVLGIVETSLLYQNIKIFVKVDFKGKFISYPNELKQVILNLIKNAEDIFLEKNTNDPWIKVRGYMQNESIVIEVEDNAGGISEAIKSKIFDPYFSTKLKKDGTGLGLYMSKTIVEDHCCGRLEVNNTQEGAVFIITLPFDLNKVPK